MTDDERGRLDDPGAADSDGIELLLESVGALESYTQALFQEIDRMKERIQKWKSE
jgi:uncharacterized small protein (DUF1192 family)